MRKPVLLPAAVLMLAAMIVGSRGEAISAPRASRSFTLRMIAGTSNVTSIVQSSGGVIWFVQNNHLCRYEGDAVTCVDAPTRVSRLVALPGGDTLVFSESPTQIYRLPDAGGEPVLVQEHADFPPDIVDACFWRDTVWVASRSVLVPILGSAMRSNPIDVGHPILAVSALNQGLLLAATDGGGFSLAALNGKPVPYGSDDLRAGKVIALSQGHAGDVWVGTEAGLWNQGRVIPHNSQIEGAFPFRSVRALWAGVDGIVWAGTTNGLIQILVNAPLAVFASAEGMAGEVPFSVIAKGDGTVWLTGNSGATLWDGTTFHAFGVANGFRHIDLRTLAPNPRGGVWFGGYKSGLWTLAESRARPVNLPIGSEKQGVRSLLTLADGSLLIALEEGGVGVRLLNGNWTPVLFDEPVLPLVGPMIERGDTIWVGFRDQGFGRIQNGRLERKVPSSLAGSSTGALALDRQTDAVWLGTRIGLFRHQGGDTRSVTIANGLPSNEIHSLNIDETNRIWAGTDKGVFVVAIEDIESVWSGVSQQVRAHLFDVRDGMRASETIRDFFPSAVITDTGMLWQPTVNGAAVFDTRRLPEVHMPPTVAIADFLCNGQPVSTGTLAHPVGRGEISFRLSAPVFIDAHRLVVQYRLRSDTESETDSAWMPAVGTRHIHFQGLRAGSFMIEARAFFSEQPSRVSLASRSLTLRPPLYQTWPFYLMVLLAVALAIALQHRARTQRMRSRFNEVLAERRRISRDMHDTLQQDLVGLKFHVETALLTQDIQGPARVHLLKAAELATEGVRDLRDSIGGLAASTLSVAGIQRKVAQQMERLFAGGSLVTRVEHQGTAGTISVQAATEVLQIVREAITNVHKHSNAKHLTVSLISDGKVLKIVVKDDGDGFDPNSLSKGSGGLDNMRLRAGAARVGLGIRSAPGQGCTIELTAPITKDP